MPVAPALCGLPRCLLSWTVRSMSLLWLPSADDVFSTTIRTTKRCDSLHQLILQQRDVLLQRIELEWLLP